MYNTEHRKVNTLKNKLVKLFFSTLYLSAFTFGGGYVIVSLMRKKFVDDYHWIDEDEMLDLVAIAQSAPGPIAVNGAIVVGYKMAGLLGIFISVLATIIPPFVIISVISVFYEIFKTNLIVSLMLKSFVSIPLKSFGLFFARSTFSDKSDSFLIVFSPGLAFFHALRSIHSSLQSSSL